MSRIWELYFGNGPSSKVSTTSWSASGRVLAYCMVPMMGCSRGSTTSVRDVPIASGWPWQSAADAAWTPTQVSTDIKRPAHNAVDDHPLSLTSALAIIEPRLHSKSSFGPARDGEPKV